MDGGTDRLTSTKHIRLSACNFKDNKFICSPATFITETSFWWGLIIVPPPAATTTTTTTIIAVEQEEDRKKNKFSNNGIWPIYDSR